MQSEARERNSSRRFIASPCGSARNTTSAGARSPYATKRRSVRLRRFGCTLHTNLPACDSLAAWVASTSGWSRRIRRSSPPMYPAAPTIAAFMIREDTGTLSARAGERQDDKIKEETMEESVTCTQCGRVFDERGELDDHTRETHGKAAETLL